MGILRLALLLGIIGSLHVVAGAQSPDSARWDSDPPAAEIVSPRPTFPKLAAREASDAASSDATAERRAPSAIGSTATVASSLAVVLGLFAGLIWLTRRFGSGNGSGRALPREACEVLGSATIEPRLKVTLLRVGGRVVVLGQTAQGVQPLSEIADVDEAQRLIAACRGESAQGFAQELKAMEKEAYRPGFIEPTPEPTAASRRRLFATA